MTIARIFSAGVAAMLVLTPEAFGQKSKAKKAADYFPLQTGYSWTYRNSEEGGYTLKVLNEEPHEDGPTRYVVELLSGVKVLKTYSKTPGWVLYHSETYPEHEGLQAT